LRGCWGGSAKRGCSGADILGRTEDGAGSDVGAALSQRMFLSGVAWLGRVEWPHARPLFW
jgi:hypothetical protein